MTLEIRGLSRRIMRNLMSLIMALTKGKVTSPDLRMGASIVS